MGFTVNIPLRIFDRNQGEKLRTQLDIGRNEKLRDAALCPGLQRRRFRIRDADSKLTLLRPYKAHYLKQAVQVRETISFAYQRGGASLLDFLSAQNDYRSIELNYLNLVGAYMTAAAS